MRQVDRQVKHDIGHLALIQDAITVSSQPLWHHATNMKSHPERLFFTGRRVPKELVLRSEGVEVTAVRRLFRELSRSSSCLNDLW